MSETATDRLLQVFQVDRQLRGLRSRLMQAERFLAAQTTQLGELESKKSALEAQLRQLQAVAADHEGEAARLDAKVEAAREQMNTAGTAREYKGHLTEVNTFKADKEKSEAAALETMQQVEDLQAQLVELEAAHAERVKVCEVAASDRATREAEIAERVAELEADLTRLRELAPKDAIRAYDERVQRHDDEDPMAPIEEQDRKRHEYTCGSCMMELPVEAMSALLSHGSITRCTSCGVLLYLPTELAAALRPASSS